MPAYDAFMLSRANRPNIGPYSLLLHMPEMAQRLEALRIYLRCAWSDAGAGPSAGSVKMNQLPAPGMPSLSTQMRPP